MVRRIWLNRAVMCAGMLGMLTPRRYRRRYRILAESGNGDSPQIRRRGAELLEAEPLVRAFTCIPAHNARNIPSPRHPIRGWGMLRRYETIAGGAWLWRARYRKVARFIRRVRRRVRSVVWTEKNRPLLVSCALAVVLGFLVAYFAG